MGSKYVPKEIKKPVDKFIDFVDEDILDPVGEALEEQVLDPAGEFLGEEIARPTRKFVSKVTPNELQFLGGKLGGIGGGKLGTALAIAAGITNPLLLAAIAATSAAAGDVAGDYFTTDENEEFEIDKLSAAFSAITGGLAGADAARPEAFQEIGTTGVRGGLAKPVMGGAGALKPTSMGLGYAGDAAITAEQYRNISDLAAAGQAAIDAGKGTAEAFQAVDNLKQIENMIDYGLEVRDLTMLEGIAGAGRDFVAAAQPFVDPFQGADFNPFTTEPLAPGFGPNQINLNPNFGSVTGVTAPGTLTDVLISGGTPMEIAAAAGSALVPAGAEAVTQYGVDYYEALQEGEDRYREFLRQRGLRADQVMNQSRRLRRQYYTQSFKNRGYSDQEISQILLRERLIDRLEDYDPNDLPQDRKFGEDVTDSTLYAAKGGRVGFDNGGMGGIGQFVEEQKIREEFMDKMKRGLGAMEMNMKLNDPGMFGRIRNVLNPMDNEPFFYTREEMRFPDTKKRYESMIRGMDEDRAAADFEMRDKMDLVEDYMNRLDAMGTKGGMNRQKNAMGTRTTPEGDPISPDMPNGMQMDLRGGGFIPLGTKPKADDVPAMVGKNEFVLNDEAVSGIGKMLTGRPDPRAGARALYKLQNEMEAIV